MTRCKAPPPDVSLIGEVMIRQLLTAGSIGLVTLAPATAQAAPDDTGPEAAYAAFLEALTERPDSPTLFEGGFDMEVGLGGCVSSFGASFMCVADTNVPGGDGNRMFMAIVEPTADGWRIGQMWVYDRVEGLSLPGTTVAPSATAAFTTPQCEDVGDYVSPIDGDIDAIIQRAAETASGSEDVACALVTVCTSDPTAAGLLFDALVDEEYRSVVYLMLSAVCPGLVDEAGISPS